MLSAAQLNQILWDGGWAKIFQKKHEKNSPVDVGNGWEPVLLDSLQWNKRKFTALPHFTIFIHNQICKLHSNNQCVSSNSDQ